ncbi:GIY-YIG nuclease family protein [Aquisalibacillus elongatus]|uniref:Uncharacterized protein DUF4357 n=1 Tax=Aquisalibacillus elongatus TaxID=485577 RepID=A0A3N5BBW1_9BACI|nr:GIY-YIG nuclease family protein [Aquisalibacillus elongatus]RPF54429.1 uncharacterized protein DUF4357 [Aquisalibacillus elongatus]
MEKRPRTIQIFLPYGSPRGIKIAEITNRTVQAILIPRNEFNRISERHEIQNVGIYFLFGHDEENSKPQVYIGEAENCYKRLNTHNKEKDFWEVVVVFVTNNPQNQFTKSDVKYLENLSYLKAVENNRFYINQTIPQQTFVPEWRKADLEDIFNTIKILLSTLGYPLYESMRKVSETDESEIYFCSNNEVSAKGEYNEEGFIVFKGSSVRPLTTKAFKAKSKRDKLIEDKVIIEKDGKFIFYEDYQFTSPSLAASIVLGRNQNGWIAWKNKAGKTLDEIKRQ